MLEKVFSFSLDPLSAALILGGMMSFTLLCLYENRVFLLRIIKGSVSKTPSIVIGNEKPFTREENFKQYSIKRTILIAVRNDTKQFISNCKVVASFTDEKNNNKSISLDSGFTLNSTEQRYIEVCDYLENDTTNAIEYKPTPFINLLPKSMGFASHEDSLPAQRKNIVTFCLVYLEGETMEKKCYLWAKNGKLTIEECN